MLRKVAVPAPQGVATGDRDFTNLITNRMLQQRAKMILGHNMQMTVVNRPASDGVMGPAQAFSTKSRNSSSLSAPKDGENQWQ